MRQPLGQMVYWAVWHVTRSELLQLALGLWIIPFAPVVAAYVIWDLWGLLAAGWPVVWFAWTLRGERR